MMYPDRRGQAGPKLYRPTMPATWWLKRWRYILFMLREFSSVFVAAFVLLFIYELFLLSKGPEVYDLFQESLRQPAFIAFYVVAFIFAVLHTITWFAVASKVQVVKIGSWTMPPALVTGGALGAWLVVSAAVGWVLSGGWGQ